MPRSYRDPQQQVLYVGIYMYVCTFEMLGAIRSPAATPL